MARHNREARGKDQRGAEYSISYQPDWLHWVKVTRRLESGRQSTKTLFRNPGRRSQDPGERVRTRIASKSLGVDFEITVTDPQAVVGRVVVDVEVPSVRGGETETITFTISDELPPPDNGDPDPGFGDP